MFCRKTMLPASWHGRVGEVRRLLADGAHIEERGGWETTPLAVAAWGGKEDVVKLLVEHGADLSAKGKSGFTPEIFAKICLRFRTVAMLRAEPTRRKALRRGAQCVAFAMGQHERLGAESQVRVLDAGVVRMVLEQV